MRSTLRLAVLAAVALAALVPSASADASAEPRATVAILPSGTTVEEIGAVHGLAPGLVSAGMGHVTAAQTYLDMSQGNRLNPSLYDRAQPVIQLRREGVPTRAWLEIVDRAREAPASLEPGLLATTIADAGGEAWAELRPDDLAGLVVADADGLVARSGEGAGPSLRLVEAEADELAGMLARLGSDELLVAMTEPPPVDRRLLPIGIAGGGMEGTITSDTTRRRGLVTAPDLSVTLLDHLGIDVPAQMNGTQVRGEGDPDAAAVAEYQERLLERPPRETVILVSLFSWLMVAGVAGAIGGARRARPVVRLIALACAWGPTILLATAATDAGTVATTVSLGLGAPLLAIATSAAAPGLTGLALACAVTVAAHALDVVLGSPLTSLSVLGPNPSGGVRFFGIGNEHASILVPLTLVGTGAWLSARGTRPRDAARWFVAVALLVAIAYAPGRFGASVGTAIMIAAGTGVAASLAAGASARRIALALPLAALAGLALLALIDLLAGNAHLSRTVLGAEGTGALADAMERRLTLMANTFTSPVWPQLFGATAVLLVVGLVNATTILAWFEGRPSARAGFIGALAAVLIGSVANDSGSVLLVIGTIYLSACAGFFWAASAPEGADDGRHGSRRAAAGSP